MKHFFLFDSFNLSSSIDLHVGLSCINTCAIRFLIAFVFLKLYQIIDMKSASALSCNFVCLLVRQYFVSERFAKRIKKCALPIKKDNMKSLLKSCRITCADARDGHGIATALANAYETVSDFVVLM